MNTSYPRMGQRRGSRRDVDDGANDLQPIEFLDDLELSPQQEKAVELIMSGRSLRAVAAEVGVDRGTLFRWRMENAHFRVALNRWRAQVRQATADRLLALSESASDAIESSIAEGDARMAFALLGQMGCIRPGPQKPANPAEMDQGRSAMYEAFRAVADTMTEEQITRAATLLGMGVAVDNQRRAAEKAAGAPQIAT